jgi:hypothetical protein
MSYHQAIALSSIVWMHRTASGRSLRYPILWSITATALEMLPTADVEG